MFFVPNFCPKWFNMKRPTNSQISAPSKLPVVTSNKLVMAFFIHGFPLLKRRVFLACFIMEVSSFEMVVKLEAQDVWSSNFSQIDG